MLYSVYCICVYVFHSALLCFRNICHIWCKSLCSIISSSHFEGWSIWVSIACSLSLIAYWNFHRVSCLSAAVGLMLKRGGLVRLWKACLRKEDVCFPPRQLKLQVSWVSLMRWMCDKTHDTVLGTKFPLCSLHTQIPAHLTNHLKSKQENIWSVCECGGQNREDINYFKQFSKWRFFGEKK